MPLANLDTDVAWWAHAARQLETLTSPDQTACQAARARQEGLTKPPGALGKLEDLACWLAGWQRREAPRLETVEALVFAGNHGVTTQRVSPYPSTVTAQMVENFKAGGAAICQLCDAYGIDLSVVPLDLENPTVDISEAPAMSEEECAAAIARGAGAVNAACDLLVLGEMGIGNTTAAAAVCYAVLGGEAPDWTGPGTGLDASGVARKAEVVARAVDLHMPFCHEPFEALRRLGGREIAAIAGAIMEARSRHIPVLLDGFVCTAAALVPESTRPGALDHCQAGHLSAEPGHGRLLAALGLDPLVDLSMRLGEGTGAAVAYAVLRGAVATHNGMATFVAAGVDNKA